MQPQTPQRPTDASSGQPPVSATIDKNNHIGSSIPRVRTTIANSRALNSQPTFDFLRDEISPVASTSRPDRFRKSTAFLPTTDEPQWIQESLDSQEWCKKQLGDMRVENKALHYKLDHLKKEQELTKLYHENELRETVRRSEEDFKKMQLAESERSKATRQLEATLKEMTEIRDNASSERLELERKLKEASETIRVQEEALDDLKSEGEDRVRGLERDKSELESRNQSMQQTTEMLERKLDEKDTLVQEAQKELAHKGTMYGQLEAEILRLKALTGDTDTLGVVKRQLSEQVLHIKKLESQNKDMLADLNHYKSIYKSVEVVEEEKRYLQRRIDGMKDLEAQLLEANMQRQRLEDERSTWTAYLEREAESGGTDKFDSPESMARALVAERLQTATLVERIGSLEAELSCKVSITRDLEKKVAKFAEQVENFNASSSVGNTLTKAQLRLERQKNLAIKEVEYLRAQLKAYETDDTTLQSSTIDEAKIKLISELEDLVEKYRQEQQFLHQELTRAEEKLAEDPTQKRKREESIDDSRQDQLLRKLRNVQIELHNLKNENTMLKKDLLITKERLDEAMKQSKTRILSIRSNPTTEYEAIKSNTLKVLKNENADLLARLQDSAVPISQIPRSVYDAAQLEVSEAQQALASEKKRNDRLMKVWGAKSSEFRQMVISLLGWDVVFMRDGKTRLSSFYYPSHDDEENSIVFDGDKGTMKISGGPKSAFAVKICDQIRFWCKDRGSIPCFLAALTLEFWEETNGDRTLRNDDE
ncbi:unnamed protein product [Blumeria hordei]|uniref:Spindle assembly checkpoint component MAD1 n=2 Tax=Blumeria hordei TaxID=2867405 RepID=A0A383UP78_BLUHO|nr:spindle assembly checkpoint component MAD1 [Blumeria hordei DH14]SZF02121.1 unnamed protein product [Blumeria hordei]